MYEGHRPYAVLAFPEHLHVALVPDVSRLEIEEAGYNLEIVLHPVMDLFQEDFFLIERRTELVPSALLLQYLPYAVPEQRELMDIGFGVPGFLVRHAGQRHDRAPFHDGDVEGTRHVFQGNRPRVRAALGSIGKARRAPAERIRPYAEGRNPHLAAVFREGGT